jgi:hypothetical protein
MPAQRTSASRLAAPSGAKIAGSSAGLAGHSTPGAAQSTGRSATSSDGASELTRPPQKLAVPSWISGWALA